MGAPLEICRKRSAVAVLASGVVISLTAMTGGIAPAFAAPKTDPVAPTTTVVAPEPKAPQETPTVAEEPAAPPAAPTTRQAPPSAETPPKPQISEAPAIAAAPPETQAPKKTQAPEPETQAPRRHRRRRTQETPTPAPKPETAAPTTAPPTTAAPTTAAPTEADTPATSAVPPEPRVAVPSHRRAGADDVDRAEPDEFDADHLQPCRLAAAVGRTGGSRPGTEPGSRIERCPVDTDQRFCGARNAGRPDRGVVQRLRGREGDPDRAASDVAGARAGRRARQERENR